MKRALFLGLASLLLLPLAFAGGKGKKKATIEETEAMKKATADATMVVDDKEIHWMSLDEVQVAMKKEPRKVWVDVYTDWCGWCKRMDKTTFSNPNVIRYMNEHFYAVKLDAEQKGDIRFMGKMYQHSEADRTHPFATQLLQGQMSYPTTVIMQENFQTPQPIPGYQDVKTVEMIMKYFGEGFFMKTPFQEYQSGFKQTWM